MPNSLDVRKIIDGERSAVFAITILGDGTGDYSSELMIDVSTLEPNHRGVPCSEVSIMKMSGFCINFFANLLWDGNTDALSLGFNFYSDFSYDFQRVGGLVNPKPAGFTGDIMITTNSLGAAETGFIYLEVVKKY